MKKARKIDTTKESFILKNCLPIYLYSQQALGWHRNTPRLTKHWQKRYMKSTNMPYASVLNFIRTKCQFALFRSTFAAMRGYIGANGMMQISNISRMLTSVAFRDQSISNVELQPTVLLSCSISVTMTRHSRWHHKCPVLTFRPSCTFKR